MGVSVLPESGGRIGVPDPGRQVQPPDRHLPLAGTRNLRDVGGYPAGPGRTTRWRTLLRTDALDRLPVSSQDALIDLGIRQVIDLRWPQELVEYPSVFRRDNRVRYRSIPLVEDDPTPGIGLAGTYRYMLDNTAPRLLAVVRSLIEPGGLPAVVGCAAGKDRTGVVIAVVLSAVGVPAEVIAADYVLTAERFAADTTDEHLEGWRAGPVELDCRPEYMLEALDHLERRHGGAAALLRGAGLTDFELDRLAEALTEPIPPGRGV